jgi:Predicted nucleoside-diphosphate sugar epimerases
VRSALIHLPRHYKRLILALSDLAIIELCLLLAFSFRLNWWPHRILDTYWPVFLATPVFILISLYRFGLYSSVTRHAGAEVLQVLARGVSVGVLVCLLVFFLHPISPPLPRSVLLLSWGLIIFSAYYARVLAGKWLHGAPLPSLMMDLAGLRTSG